MKIANSRCSKIALGLTLVLFTAITAACGDSNTPADEAAEAPPAEVVETAMSEPTVDSGATEAEEDAGDAMTGGEDGGDADSGDADAGDPDAGDDDGSQTGAVTSIDGVGLPMPAGLVDTVTAERVLAEGIDPETGVASADGPAWAAVPEHIVLRLEGYPSMNALHEPVIRVYPAAGYALANPAVSDATNTLGAMIDADPTTWSAHAPMPFLPTFNAAQVFSTQPARIDFEGGRGIRFVTMFSQAYVPVTNAEIFYTFQGLTADGSRYVSAILPVRTDALSDEIDLTTWEVPGEDYASYIEDTRAELDALGPADFEPGLEALDEMIASLTVEPGGE